jgi:hypothetical protein
LQQLIASLRQIRRNRSNHCRPTLALTAKPNGEGLNMSERDALSQCNKSTKINPASSLSQRAMTGMKL